MAVESAPEWDMDAHALTHLLLRAAAGRVALRGSADGRAAQWLEGAMLLTADTDTFRNDQRNRCSKEVPGKVHSRAVTLASLRDV